MQLSEQDNAGTDQTAEGRMLDASREELKKEVSKDVHGLRRLRDTIVLYVDVYLWEPLCTGLRFLHLVVIFVPVILTVPTIWFGARDKQRSDERSGTLWWYWFLVRSMERAGPAFIKVSSMTVSGYSMQSANDYSLDNGQLRERTSFPQKCARSCHNCTPMRLHTRLRRRNEL